jgi:hypothetical protein
MPDIVSDAGQNPIDSFGLPFQSLKEKFVCGNEDASDEVPAVINDRLFRNLVDLASGELTGRRADIH